jgi:hypothetical protein
MADEYTIPDSWANLNEVASPPPVENPKEQDIYRHHSLEEVRTHEQDYMRRKHSALDRHASTDPGDSRAVRATVPRRASCFTFLTRLRDRLLRR